VPAASLPPDPPWARLLPVAAVALAAGPLLLHGYPKGHDWTLELARLVEWRAAVAEGEWLPAWAGDVYRGLGAPVFVFYAPLFSALACGAGALLGSLEAGAVAAVAAALALAALGMQRLAAAATGDASAARVAAVLYVLSPYLVCDAYARNADAELLGLALLPLPLLGVLRAAQEPRRAAALLALGLALVVLAHNLTALVAAALVGLGAAWLHARRGGARALGATAGGAALGLGLAAFFWVPALAYRPLVRSEELLAGKFDYTRHFLTPAEAFGLETWHSAGPLAPLLLAAAALALVRAAPGAPRRLLAGCLAGAVGFAFLTGEPSALLWRAVPWLPLFQFPFRWLGPLSLLAALAGALAFAVLLSGRGPRPRALAQLAILALAVANALPALRRAEPLPGVRARREALLTPDGVRARGLRVTARREYLPRAADPELPERRPATLEVAPGAPELALEIEEERPRRLRFTVHAEAPARLRVARLAFPGWEVQVEGARAPARAGGDGRIEIEVPAGARAVELCWRGPPLRAALLPLSGGAALVWLLTRLGLPRRARGAGPG
jgi:hypothetical protein